MIINRARGFTVLLAAARDVRRALLVAGLALPVGSALAGTTVGEAAPPLAGPSDPEGGVVRKLKHTLLLVVVNAAVYLVTAGGALASAGGVVLPPTAQPHGWSRDRMTGALALFTTSGNSPAYYPKTPFQVLYVDPSTSRVVPVNGGLQTFGSNAFTVRPGTTFFVPLFSVDDSPPVLGTWPTTPEQAIGYFFGASQYGGRGFEITVDGQSTPIGSTYLAGPVQTPPLLDGGGTHIIMLGAFLHPFTPGTHTVSVAGGVFGAELFPTYGITFLTEADTYAVTVG